VEGSCEHCNEPSGSIKLLGSCRVAAQHAVSEEVGLNEQYAADSGLWVDRGFPGPMS
jgi:hypothetical protein